MSNSKCYRVCVQLQKFRVLPSLAIALIALSSGLVPTNVHALAADCGTLDNAYGPFDYTNAEHRSQRIPIVTEGHFNDDVRALIRGVTSDLPGADLDYTLRAVPNYHDALYAIARYSLQTQTAQPEGSRYTIDCWFERATKFAPHDGMVPLIHGIYLHKKKDFDGAKTQYARSVKLMPESPEAHYNLGLLHFELGEYESAKAAAVLAYSKGYPLPGLRQKLQRKGHWE